MVFLGFSAFAQRCLLVRWIQERGLRTDDQTGQGNPP